MAINIRDIFDEIGGAAKVARLMNAPVTTVWAWQKSNRIPPARLAHLRLALKANRITCRTLETGCGQNGPAMAARQVARSEEHTSELQSLMRISYAVFCLKKKTNKKLQRINTKHHN